MTYLVIGQASNGTEQGVVQLAISLAGHSIQGDGLFLIGSSTFSLATPDLTVNFSLADDRNVTHRLVRNWSGDTDVDDNDDCLIDGAPGRNWSIQSPSFRPGPVTAHTVQPLPSSPRSRSMCIAVFHIGVGGPRRKHWTPTTHRANRTMRAARRRAIAVMRHAGPSCDDPFCCNLVCQTDPFCCNFIWDGLCEDKAVALCACEETVCPNPDHTCFAIGTPGCNDAVCCQTVCNVRPECCLASWDQNCVNLAQTLCGTPAGNCCESHNTPGCQLNECQQLVCLADPFCCSASWDEICVFEASKNLICGCTCGEIDLGRPPTTTIRPIPAQDSIRL